MINIIPFEPEHFQKIQLRGCHTMERRGGAPTKAVTFMLDGEPIAIFGGFLLLDGVYQAWALVSDLVKKKPKSFHKSVKLLIEYYIEKLELRRVQITVRCDYGMGWKWAKSLGFNSEGILKKYGPDGSDYWLFARVA